MRALEGEFPRDGVFLLPAREVVAVVRQGADVPRSGPHFGLVEPLDELPGLIKLPSFGRASHFASEFDDFLFLFPQEGSQPVDIGCEFFDLGGFARQ